MHGTVAVYTVATLARNFPVSVVKILTLKIHFKKSDLKRVGFCSENSELKVFPIAKEEKDISL